MRANLCVATGTSVLLLASLLPALSDDVPVINVDPVCRGIAQQAGSVSEKGAPDLRFSQCVKSEQAIRDKLAKEWSTFTAADKGNCVGEEKSGPLPSYTDLITCLEMARDVREMNAKK